MENRHAASVPFNLCRAFTPPAGFLFLNIIILTNGKAGAKNRKNNWPKQASLGWESLGCCIRLRKGRYKYLLLLGENQVRAAWGCPSVPLIDSQNSTSFTTCMTKFPCRVWYVLGAEEWGKGWCCGCISRGRGSSGGAQPLSLNLLARSASSSGHASQHTFGCSCTWSSWTLLQACQWL